MSHRTRTTSSRQDDSTGPHATVPRSAIPVRPRVDTKTTLSVTRRLGLPSSPRDNLSTAATSTSISPRLQQTTSPMFSPNIASSISRKLPSPATPSMNVERESPRPRFGYSRSAPENVPLLLDTSRAVSRQPRLHMSQNQYSSLDTDKDTVLGVAMPSQLQPKRSDLPPRLIPELQALAGHLPKQSRPPASSISTISSPSTRFTESPAPWSASTTTTPLSWSSASPALTQTHGLMTPERRFKTVPQPSQPRSRLPKLPSITKPAPQPRKDESSEAAMITESPVRPRRKKSILTSPPPTPPPRTSSVKRSGRSGNSSIDETLSRTAPSRPSTAPSSTQREPPTSELRSRGNRADTSTAVSTHENLQQSIRAPIRPTRSGTLDLGESRPAVMNTHRGGFSPQQRHLLDAGFVEVTRSGPMPSSSAAASDSELSMTSEKSRRSPGRLGKFSRFRLFGQREEPLQDSDKGGPNKLQRRGPAAGTGHEGYGKLTRRGRKQSAESSASQSESERSRSSNTRVPLIPQPRKSSTTSRRPSQADVDEFAVPRLRPVILRGGSQASVMSDAFSNEQAIFTSPGREAMLQQFPSPAQESYHATNDQRHRSPLAGNDKEAFDPVPSAAPLALAVRRSQRLVPGTQSTRLPAPIRVSDASSAPPMSSYDTTVSSALPSSAILSTSSDSVNQIDPSLLKDKKSRRRWWNPFRTRPSTTAPEPATARRLGTGMAVNVQAGPTPRTIPYYAMLGSETEFSPADNVEQVLAEANRPSPPSPSPDLDNYLAPGIGHDSVRSPAIYSEELMAEPCIDESVAQYEERFPPSRQPRLAQIGRIPKVVTRAERQHRPSRQSFSQPFPRPISSDLHQGFDQYFQTTEDEPPLLQIHTDVLPSRPFYETDSLSAKPASAPARSHPHQLFSAEPAMIDLVPVRSLPASDRSASSCSAGLISIMGPPIIPASSEQDIYEPMKRLSGGDEEDVWNEFDDIIDHVMSPSRSPGGDFSPEMPTKRPFKHVVTTAHGSPMMDYSSMRPLSRGKMPIPEPRRGVLDLHSMGVETPPVMLPSPSLLSERSAGEETRLRRSRIISALHSSYNPTSPFSMREFLKDYSELRDSTRISERLSTSTAARSTLIAAAHLDDVRRGNHQDNAVMLDVAGRIKDPIMQSELHYASLEVSRWLSFGRVLFSPAQDEIFTLPDRHVLVIDGLGNEDWSIYCAVTYEAAKAVVHDLKETSHYKKPPSPQGLEHLPPNLRRAEVASFTERFPFHSAFFSVIVLRFPPAMSEAKMKNIITECRRILVPGGHIEVMLLDLDFVNMGVQTRRAVREMKMRMQTKDPNVNLKPTIDHFQTVLGSRGFTGLSRCVVGVPVVGKAPGSADSSTSSQSGTSLAQHNDPITARRKPSRHGRNFSLSDLVTDPSESADAQIGRMVSKTARNWWQHCYEAAVLPNGDVSRSIFAEKKVLLECKMRASSFKLLIAYAQRPVFEGQVRRRTMSESAAVSAVTTGGPRRTRGPMVTAG